MLCYNEHMSDRLYADLLLLKLGGSLITDKARPRTARLDLIARLAMEIKAAKMASVRQNAAAINNVPYSKRMAP